MHGSVRQWTLALLVIFQFGLTVGVLIGFVVGRNTARPRWPAFVEDLRHTPRLEWQQ